MGDCNSNINSNSKSISCLSASAPPFNFNSNSKPHDHDRDHKPSNYCLEGFYGFNYGFDGPCDDSFGFENEPTSFLFKCPSQSKSESYQLDTDAAAAASVASNCIFKLANNFSQAQEIRASGGNTTLLLRKLCLSEILDSCGDAAVNKENYTDRLSEVDVCADAAVIKGENYSTFNPSSKLEPHVLQNAKDTTACYERILVDKGKEKQNCETVINEAIDTLFMSKKDLSPCIRDEFKLESRNDESFVPGQASSVMSNPNDSDVDSPCWKGTGFCQSAFRDTVPMSSDLPKIEGESHKSLNPLAPHFFPGSARPLVYCHGNKCEESDFSSYNKAASSVALSTKEHRLIDFVNAGACSSEVSNAIDTQFSNDNHDAGKEYSLPKKLHTSSVLHSSFGDGPCLAKEDLTFNGQGVTGANVSGSVKGMKPAILNGSTRVSFATTGNLLTSLFSSDSASSHFCESLRGASKSTPPEIDVQLVIKSIHDLSELLRWKCSNDLVSINEHEQDMIRRVMENLCGCVTNKVQQRVSLSESGHPCNSLCPVKVTDRHKEFQVKKMKSVTAAHVWERQKSSQANFGKKAPVSSSSRSNEGIKIGDVPRARLITSMQGMKVKVFCMDGSDMYNWCEKRQVERSYTGGRKIYA